MSQGYMTRSSTLPKRTTDFSPHSLYTSDGKNGYASSASSKIAASSKPPSLKRKRGLGSSAEHVLSTQGQHHTSSKTEKSSSARKPKLGKTIKNKDGAEAFPAEDASSPPKKGKGLQSPAKDKDEEKRLRVFRKKAPLSYLEKLRRATSQRMFVIDRTRGGTDEVPEETIDMAGTTGNIYSITISQIPHCTCPDNRKGNQCKHIVYVLHNVLKAPEHLQYQLAFLSSELRTIFANAPIVCAQPSTDSSSNRKEVSGDCPICFTEFEPDTEEIVWCKAACGNNIHQGCFEQWAASQKGKEVRCVYCRTPWQGDPESLARIKTGGNVNEEGYVNVADQLGLSGERDYSSYHQFWVRRHFGGYGRYYD